MEIQFGYTKIVNAINSLFSARNENLKEGRAEEWAADLLLKVTEDAIIKTCERMKYADINKITVSEILRNCNVQSSSAIQLTRSEEWEYKATKEASDAWYRLQLFAYNQIIHLNAKEYVAVKVSGIDPIELSTANEMLWFKIGNEFKMTFDKINIIDYQEEMNNYRPQEHELVDYKNEFHGKNKKYWIENGMVCSGNKIKLNEILK